MYYPFEYTNPANLAAVMYKLGDPPSSHNRVLSLCIYKPRSIIWPLYEHTRLHPLLLTILPPPPPSPPPPPPLPPLGVFEEAKTLYERALLSHETRQSNTNNTNNNYDINRLGDHPSSSSSSTSLDIKPTLYIYQHPCLSHSQPLG